MAKLDASQFEQIAAGLNPFSTAKEISEALDSKKKNEKEKQVIDLTLSFGTMGSATKKEVYDAIIELKRKFGFSLKEGSIFIDEMKTVQKLSKVA